VSIPPKPHPIYSKDSTVYIIHERKKLKCLDDAIDKSGFIKNLNDHCGPDKSKRETFRIVIKPNFMCAAYETDISVYTDVELVEHLVERIRGEGYEDITVVESQMVWSVMRDGRTVQAVADMLGFSGNDYKIVDLSIHPDECDYDEELLGRDWVGPVWKDADYRISFAKNKTHFQCFYTGCMKNIYGCLPTQNKLLCYHRGPRNRRRHFYTATIAILEKFQVDFAFLDAYISSDGVAGIMMDGWPKGTHTIICGENCFAVDWVQGEKMGLDPEKNYVVRTALERWGKPQITRMCSEKGLQPHVCSKKELEPWHPWENVPGFFVVGGKLVEKHYQLARAFLFPFAYRMDPRFPLVDNCMSILTAPFRKLVEMLDLHEDLIYPALIIFDSALIIALIVFLFVVGCRS